MLTLAVKPQWVRSKLDKTIEQPCSDFLAHTSDNHDSWGTCTTSARCKTIIIVMLSVMSGMDPHMISGTWDGF
jgi:hypothetical protein